MPKKGKDLHQTWEDYYKENAETALKDKSLFSLELKTFSEKIRLFLKGRNQISILELGCGTGLLAKEITEEVLKGKSYTYTGIDFSAQAISLAKKRNLPHTFFMEEDFLRFFEKSKKNFDLIISQRSIMAIMEKEEQLKLLSLIKERLSKKGMGIFTECLHDSFVEMNYLREKLGIKPLEKVWHSRYLRLEEIKKVFPKHKIIDFCSTYWFVTRIIYPYFEEPKHNSKLAEVVSTFPEHGNFGMVKLILVKP